MPDHTKLVHSCMTVPMTTEIRQPSMSREGFQVGHPRFGGRQKGTRNRAGADLRHLIMEAAIETGFPDKDANGNPIATGRDGCKGWLRWLYLHEPKTAAALLARTMPYFITVTEQSPVATRAEIEEEFRELGCRWA
jgi:hypothetical protein